MRFHKRSLVGITCSMINIMGQGYYCQIEFLVPRSRCRGGVELCMHILEQVDLEFVLAEKAALGKIIK